MIPYQPVPFWVQAESHDSPIISVALHDGHLLRPEVALHMQLDDIQRLREEDPHTGRWATLTTDHVIVQYSRFEVDLNRPRHKAIYRKPEDAWGLHVYREELPDDVTTTSLERYDAFYCAMEGLLWKKQMQFGRVVVLDLHSYNHRRAGPDSPVADPLGNPEINLGTATISQPAVWHSLIECFIGDLRHFQYQGRQLDVRENIKFKGGEFARWAHQRFPSSVCVLSIEVKKFFMDEWSGVADIEQVELIRQLLASTLPGLCRCLESIHGCHYRQTFAS